MEAPSDVEVQDLVMVGVLVAASLSVSEERFWGHLEKVFTSSGLLEWLGCSAKKKELARAVKSVCGMEIDIVCELGFLKWAASRMESGKDHAVVYELVRHIFAVSCAHASEKARLATDGMSAALAALANRCVVLLIGALRNKDRVWLYMFKTAFPSLFQTEAVSSFSPIVSNAEKQPPLTGAEVVAAEKQPVSAVPPVALAEAVAVASDLEVSKAQSCLLLGALTASVVIRSYGAFHSTLSIIVPRRVIDVVAGVGKASGSTLIEWLRSKFRFPGSCGKFLFHEVLRFAFSIFLLNVLLFKESIYELGV